MMSRPSIPRTCVLGWEAWAPALQSRDQWRAWLPDGGPLAASDAAPRCKGAPPMLRRRYSLPSRMVIETVLRLCEAAGVAPSETHLIFGSANGEIEVLKALMEDLCQDQPLSPTAFSNSVHHVPTGHFGMATQHKTLSRTLSSYKDTFLCCFLEAACLLRRQPEKPALLVVAEEIPPVPFDMLLAMPPFPYAAALLLGAEGASLRFDRAPNGAEPHPRKHIEPAFDFLRWLEGDAPALRLEAAFGVYEWRR